MSWWGKKRKPIWKLLRPLFDSTGEYNQVLAYTEDRSDSMVIPATPEQIAALFGDVDIIYVEAHLEDGDDTRLVIDKRVKARDW
jgi:hypothetical protein